MAGYRHIYHEWHLDHTGHWTKVETESVLAVTFGYGQKKEVCLISLVIFDYWMKRGQEACWMLWVISWVLVLSSSFQIWRSPLLFEGKGTSSDDER